jgi:internalin A
LKRNQLPVGLDKIQNLSSLDLSDNGYLTDIGLLSKCLHLTSLDLSSCSIQNVDGLANLTKLTSLDLSDCDSLQNVDGLANLSNLRSLDLSYCDEVQTKPSNEEMTTREEVAAYQKEIKKLKVN